MILTYPTIEMEELPVSVVPEPGLYWRGVAHKELVEYIHNAIHFEVGWTLLNSSFTLLRDAADMEGTFLIGSDQNPPPPGTDCWLLTVVTSNGKRRPIQLIAGVAFSTVPCPMEVIVEKKHTTNLNVREEVEFAVDDFRSSLKRINTLVRTLGKTVLTRSAYESLLCAAGRDGIMPWSRLGKIDALLRRLKVAGDGGCLTALSLLLAFAEVARLNPPIVRVDQTLEFCSRLQHLCEAKES